MAAAAAGGKTPKRKSASTGAKARYWFDNAMARGPIVVIAYLAALSLFLVTLAALIAVLTGLVFAGGASDTFPEAMWQAMLRTLDSGSFAADTAWPTRLLALVVTLAGIFLAGSLIGLIANAVDQKVEELRRGRSPVIESGHTLILGWSPQVPRIISELVIANESEKCASVVVLASEDKTVMEEVLRKQVGPSNDPHRLSQRQSVVARRPRAGRRETARSIVIVRDDDGEAEVVKAVLAVRVLDPGFERAHVVAELDEADNTESSAPSVTAES